MLATLPKTDILDSGRKTTLSEGVSIISRPGSRSLSHTIMWPISDLTINLKHKMYFVFDRGDGEQGPSAGRCSRNNILKKDRCN